MTENTNPERTPAFDLDKTVGLLGKTIVICQEGEPIGCFTHPGFFHDPDDKSILITLCIDCSSFKECSAGIYQVMWAKSKPTATPDTKFVTCDTCPLQSNCQIS